MHGRILQVLMAFAQAAGTRTAGIVLWLLQPILVLFLRWVPFTQATQTVWPSDLPKCFGHVFWPCILAWRFAAPSHTC